MKKTSIKNSEDGRGSRQAKQAQMADTGTQAQGYSHDALYNFIQKQEELESEDEIGHKNISVQITHTPIAPELSMSENVSEQIKESIGTIGTLGNAPGNYLTYQLSSSVGGSYDAASPGLLRGPGLGHRAVSQSERDEILQPQIIDILVADQQAMRPATETLEELAESGLPSRHTATQPEGTSPTTEGRSLSLQIQQIKNAAIADASRAHNPGQRGASRTSQPDRVAARATKAAKNNNKQSEGRSQAHVKLSRPGRLLSTLIMSPRQQQFRHNERPPFLQTERFLQVSKMQVGINEEVKQQQQLRKGQVKRFKQAAALQKQQSDDQSSFDEPQIHGQPEGPVSLARKPRQVTVEVPPSPRRPELSHRAAQDSQRGPVGSLLAAKNGHAGDMQKPQGGAGLAEQPSSKPARAEDVLQAHLDAAVTVPDVFIRKRTANGGKIGASDRDAESASRSNVASMLLNSVALSPRLGAWQLQSSTSDASQVPGVITSPSGASGPLRGMSSTKFARNQPMFLSALSDQDQREQVLSVSGVMHRTKQNPAKINRFMEKFGGGKEATMGCTSQDPILGNVVSDKPPSTRPKTSELDGGAMAAKSFDTLSPKSMAASGPNAPRFFSNNEIDRNDGNRPVSINVKKRYAAQRNRRAQIMSLNIRREATQVTEPQRRALIKTPQQTHAARGKSQGARPDAANFVSQSMNRQRNPSEDSATLTHAKSKAAAGIFQEKPSLKFEPSAFFSRRGQSASQNRYPQPHRRAKGQAGVGPSPQNATSATSGADDGNQTFSWDQLRARDTNFVMQSFSAQDPSYRRAEATQRAKQPLPRSHVKVPDILRSHMDSVQHSGGVMSLTGSIDLQNLISSRHHNVTSQQTTDEKAKIRVMRLDSARQRQNYTVGPSREDDLVIAMEDQTESPQTRIHGSRSLRSSPSAGGSASGSLSKMVDALASSDPRRPQMRPGSSPGVRTDRSPSQPSARAASPRRGPSRKRKEQSSALAAGDSGFIGWHEGLEFAPEPEASSDQVPKMSNKLSVSMRVDSKMSLQQAMAAEKKEVLATGEQHVRKSGHRLQCRVEGKFLPTSVERLPQDDIQRAVHEMRRKQNFDNVVDIGLRHVSAENFVASLTGIDTTKIEALIKKESQKPTEDTSKTESASQGTAGAPQRDAKQEGSLHQISSSLGTSQSQLTVQEEQKEEPVVRAYVPPRVRIEVHNPLFRLDERPAVLDVLCRDVIHVFVADRSVDIFAYKAEDYLDGIRRLTAPEEVALSVRVAHDLMGKWVHYVKPPPPPPKRTKRARKYKQGAAHASQVSFAEASLGQRERSSEDISKRAPSLQAPSAAPPTDLRREDSCSIASTSQATGMLGFGPFVGRLDSTKDLAPGEEKQNQVLSAALVSFLSNVRGARHEHMSVDSREDPEKLPALHQDRSDVANKRLVVSLYEAGTLRRVSVKLEVDFEAILKLQRKVAAYSSRRIQNVLPLAVFDDYEGECLVIQKEIHRRRLENLDPILCTVTMKDEETGRRARETGAVLDYVQLEQSFIVVVNEKQHFMHRLCLQFSEFESRSEIESRRVQAMKLSKAALLRLNTERIFYSEALNERPELRQPADTTNNIERRADLERLGRLTGRVFASRDIRALVEQFEALYCHAMLKSIVMSETEQEDPRFACMVTGYKIERNAADQSPYFGLQAYERNKGPIDHLISKRDCQSFLASHSLLGRRCFQQAFEFITAQTLDILDRQALFQVPIAEGTAYALVAKPQVKSTFKSVRELISATQEYPVRSLEFARLQQEVAKDFHQVVVNKWQASIVRFVRQVILDNFNCSADSLLTRDESEINPYISRFLKSVYQLQISHLFDKYERGLRSYLEFLLRFANLSEDFRQKQAYLDYQLDKVEVDCAEQSLIVADVSISVIAGDAYRSKRDDLTHRPGMNPFKAAMRRLRPAHAGQKLVTAPSLEDIYTQLGGVLSGLCFQFLNIPSVGGQVYKFAGPGKKHIQVSVDLAGEYGDGEAVEEDEFQGRQEATALEAASMSATELRKKDRVYVLRRQIELVVTDIVEQVNAQLVALRPYVKFVGYKFADVIFDLRSLLFQNQMDKKMQTEEEDFNAMLSFDAQETIRDDQLLKLIEKTDITDHTYRAQYNELEEAYWGVQREVHDQYDFGLVQLDCRAFKARAERELKALLGEFRERLLQDFLKHCGEQTDANSATWQKVEASHIDIDRVIEQIDYVNSLQQDEVQDEMIALVRYVGQKKRFLDTLAVPVPEEAYLAFLDLHSFPRRLRALLARKARALRIEQKKIARLIRKHSEKTKGHLQTFSLKFKAFRQVKLPTRAEFAEKEKGNPAYAATTLEKMAQDGLGTGAADAVWDSAMVEEQAAKIQALSEMLAQVEEDTKTINRRQEALQMKISDFPELARLKAEIKPSVQLWETIAQYNAMIDDWKDRPITKMTLEEIEEFCNEWYRKLLFVMRNSSLAKWPGPKQFAAFIMREVEHIRQYLPLLQCLKVKGLERRHLREISRVAREEVQLGRINFRWLVTRDLHKGKKYPEIKNISDTAAKEYQVKLTIESVEYEVENTKMTAIKYKDSIILKNLPRDLANFTECDLKISSVAHNNFAKIFKERIDRLQGDLRRITQLLAVWNDLQKYWAYLLPIFQQRDIAQHMPENYERFVQIDRLYRQEVAGADTRCRTYKKFCRRESLRHNVPIIMQQFEYLMKCLIRYLEAKRRYFPRLYFLSNEQIIEIVGMMEDISLLEKNLFKMFEGVDRLVVVYDEDLLDEVQSEPSSGDAPLESRNRARPKAKVWRAQDTRLFRQGLATCLGTRPVRDVDSDLGRILGLCNHDGELIEFEESVKVTDTIEHWLKRVEYCMRYNVARTIQQTLHSYEKTDFLEWVRFWPTQFVLAVLEVDLSRQLEKVFAQEAQKSKPTRVGKTHHNAFGKQRTTAKRHQVGDTERGAAPAQQFRKIHAALEGQVRALSNMIRDQLPNSVRLTINTLIINRVHSRDTVRNMIDAGIERSSDFLWKIQMRHVLTEHRPPADEKEIYQKAMEERERIKEERAANERRALRTSSLTHEEAAQVLKRREQREVDFLSAMAESSYPAQLHLTMVDADQPYAYEFLSNAARLVISPLTERCFQALFLALHFKYGGAPIGPAGTGKTESIKELSRTLARHCFIFNCQGQLDYASMTKFFKGLAACGTWACFDEFNRLEVSVLSIISQLIVSISNAKHEGAASVTIEGTALPFEKNCGLFITMNPFHFGRTPLPDSLKVMFRQVTMVVPDTLFIAEIVLYSVGFQSARSLAFKITRTFALIQEQLRFEQHYDFGLRTVKQVLAYAGEVKLRCMRVKTKQVLESDAADTALTDHIGTVQRCVVRRGKKKKKPAGAALRSTLLSQLRDQGGDGSAREPKDSKRGGGISTTKTVLEKEAVLDAHGNKTIVERERQQKEYDLKGDEDIEDVLDTSWETSDGSEDESSISGSSTEERIKRLTKAEGKSEDSVVAEAIEEEQREDTDDDSESRSELSDLQTLGELGLDINYVLKDLGCDSKKVLMDEDLLDQFIILKAVMDKNLPKLVFRDITILQNIVSDVFPNIPVPALVNKNAVCEMIDSRLARRNLFRGSDFVQNIHNIYEALLSRHGIMVVGQPVSGKTTSLRILQDTLNALHVKESGQRTVAFQRLKAQRMGIQTRPFKGQLVPKDDDPDLQLKFALTPEEKQLILDTCFHKGVSNFSLNPKSVTASQLMGSFDDTSREWTDGVLAHGIRCAAQDATGKRLLVTCDGPIEPDWVENLNSVLDDNKRLSLVTGETLYLTDRMNVILEAAGLDDCTPATISRCAICYIRRETLPAKAQFNHWLQTLPKILKDQQERLDLFANFFITDILESFLVPEKMLYPVTPAWATMTFIRILDSLIFQYRNEKYTDQRCLKKVLAKISKDAAEAENRRAAELLRRARKQEHEAARIETAKRLARVSRTRTVGAGSVQAPDLAASSSAASKISEASDEEDESGSGTATPRPDSAADASPPRAGSRASPHSGAASEEEGAAGEAKADDTQEKAQAKDSGRLSKAQTLAAASPGLEMRRVDVEVKVRPPEHTFVEVEALFEASLRQKNAWIDSFFLYALVWAFGSLLNDSGRREFNSWLHWQVKSKDQARRERLRKLDEAARLAREAEAASDASVSLSDSSRDAPGQSSSLGSEVPYMPTHDFVIGQVDHMEGSLPRNVNVFDAFFDVNSGQFQSWRSVFLYTSEERTLDRGKRSPLALTMPTQDYLRVDFLVDRLLEIKKPLVLLGPTGQGKSTLLRQYVYEKDSPQKLKSYDLVGCCAQTTAGRLQAVLEGKLVKHTKALMQPPDEKHQVYFLDDIHMAWKDRWGHAPATELLRQQIDFGGWFSTERILFKKVRDVNYVASVSTRHPGKESIAQRLGWHFAAVGYLTSDGGHIELIYKHILSKTFVHCNSTAIQSAAPGMVLQASLEFFKRYQDGLRPSPTSFLFRVNNRHMLYLLKGLLDVPNNYYQLVDNVAVIWVHEVCRTVLDRYTDPLAHQELYEVAKDIACKHFKVRPRIFPKDPNANGFYYGQPESEGCYNEAADEKRLTAILSEVMADYNKSNPQNQINVVIFSSIIEKTLKISRALQTPYAHTILVADQGTGAFELCKLAIRLARLTDNRLFANDSDHQLEDWRAQLRAIVQAVGLDQRSGAALHLAERDFVPGVLETLEGFAAHGEVFQLLGPEEVESLLNSVRYKTVSASHRGKERTEVHLLEDFRDLVHEHLHLLLQLTPRSPVLLTGLREAPHILDASTLIYFGEWSDRGFEFLAHKHLSETPASFVPLPMKNVALLSKVMIEMYHDTVRQSQLYYQETDHFVYISPQQFESFTQTYKRLYHKRSLKLLKHRERFRVGLEGIRRTQEYTENKQEELSKVSPELVKRQMRLEKLTDELEVKKGQIAKQIKLVLDIENETVYCLKEAKVVQAKCDQLMAEATPVFKHAVDGLLQITKKETNELKTIVRPLQTIVILLSAVCLVLGVEPAIVNNKDTDYRPQKCYWTSAIGPQLLGDHNVIHRMTQIDPTQIRADTMVRLEELLATGDLSAEKVQRASYATRGIYSWLMAVRNYFYVYRTSEPLRNKLILADLQLEEYNARKADNEARLRELELELKRLRELHQAKEDEVKLFQKEIEEVFILKSKAARLLNELAGEKQKWMVCEDVATQNLGNLEGDSLVAAAMVCFLSPFTQKTRDYLYAKWLMKIADYGINITRKLNFNSMFSAPLKIKGWLDNGLPNDSYSIQNAIILRNTQLQPILIDPQTQANKWLRQEKDVTILNMQTTRFLSELKLCVILGTTALIENVDQEISTKLYPLFLFEKYKQSDNKINMTIMMEGQVTQINPTFKMYITSVHKSPDFGSEISLVANFINFSVTIEAFEAQILAFMLESLEAELDATQKIYRKQALGWIKRLKTIEEEILLELKKPQHLEMLIKREFLIEKLMESRNVTKQTGKTLMLINSAMKQLMSTAKLYKGVSQRAAKFFFVASDLVKINHMYQFTHEWFHQFFCKIIKVAEIDRTSAKKKEETIRRMQADFTREFYRQVCQTLFDKDKLLFSFLLAYKELEVEFKIDKCQVEFFIKGGLHQDEEIYGSKVLKNQEKTDQEVRDQIAKKQETLRRRKNRIPWITESMWKAIDKLSTIPPFNQPHVTNKEMNLAAHIEKYPDIWLDFVNGKKLNDLEMSRYTTKDEDGHSVHSSDEERPFKREDEIPPDMSLHMTGRQATDQSDAKNDDEESGDSSDSVSDSSHNIESSAQNSESQGDPALEQVQEEQKDSVQDLLASGPSGRKLTSRFIKRVNTNRYLDLGVPGMYEKFNYEDAIKQGMEQLQLEQEVKRRIADGLRNMMFHGQSVEKTRAQKDLDDLFALDEDIDSKTNGGSKGPNSPRNGSDSASNMSDAQNVEDAFEDFRKNNVEEDTRIALAVIQGIAEYAEFKVQKAKKANKRQQMKQYVINSHMVRLCIMRCFHPEKLYHEIKSFISYFLGRIYTEQPAFDFSTIFRQTSQHVPILLMLGANVNAYTELTMLKQTLLSTQDLKFYYQPLGQLANEKITKIILDGACWGKWILLDNLNLSLDIVANLTKFLECLYKESKAVKKKLLRKAKKELLETLTEKKAADDANNANQNSNIAMEIMYLEQQIKADQFEEQQKRQAHLGKQDQAGALVEQFENATIKESTMGGTVKRKLDFIMRNKKHEARSVTANWLKTTAETKRKAEELSELRDLTSEEKALNEMVFPKTLAFPVHDDFRLWLAAIPEPSFPSNFARFCLKISLELPGNIRPNTAKTFSSFPPLELSNVTRHAREFKRMFYSMSVMHAVINQRERFGSFGWTKPYIFSPTDLHISVKMLAEICGKLKSGENFPLRLMRYLVGYINYGGKLNHPEDQIVLNSQINTFINLRVFEDAAVGRSRISKALSMLDENQPGHLYDLTGCQGDKLRPHDHVGDRAFTVDDSFNRTRSYKMPVNCENLITMRHHVRDQFPLEDFAEIFGLHQTATIKATHDIAQNLMYRTYRYQFVIKRPKQPALTPVEADRRNTQVYEFFRGKIKELAFRVPRPIPGEHYEDQIPTDRDKPFNTLLLKEIQRYNVLITKVRRNLDDTLAAMEGLQQHNADTEQAFDAIQQERTPNNWTLYCYPCDVDINKFVDNLNERLDYIKELLDLAVNDNFTIRRFWMPGFFNQRNFLTTIMQEVARKQKLSIEQLTISYRVMRPGEKQYSQIKAEGTNSYYCDGLWLYGAVWDQTEQSIMDTPKHAPIGFRLPTLHLMVEQQDNTPENGSRHSDEIREECLSTEEYQRRLYKDSHYLCPMFVNFAQNRVHNNQSAEGQLITTVPMLVKHRKPKFWVRRNICILCYNESAKE